MKLIKSIFGLEESKAIRLVIGLNQVDNLDEINWDEKLNMPSKRAEAIIKRKCEDIIRKFSVACDISKDNFEFYSATKKYNLIPLLTKIIKYSEKNSFVLGDVNPADPFEDADDEVKTFVKQEREKREARTKFPKFTIEKFIEGLKETLPEKDIDRLIGEFGDAKKSPPKIAVIGKTGVGKTTTVNNLFNAKFKESSILVGTTKAQEKIFNLDSGGELKIIDLPGYGRSIKEDIEYDKIYREIIPKCDVLLLIIQADTRDLREDQKMLIKIKSWLSETEK